jgi:flagellar biosynthesis anti-sigma factor FlgM
VNSTPEINSARVAAVQQAIASGQYKINPERIANRLVQLDQDLSNASQQ